MKTAAVIAALFVSLALQSTFAGLHIGGTTVVNLVLVVVVYVALAFGPAAGLVVGTAGGLIQDTLAGGIVGIGGFAKTLVGFLVGVLGAQFIVARPMPAVRDVRGRHRRARGVLPGAVRGGGIAQFRLPYSAMLMQALVNAFVGVLAFQLVEQGPQMLQRRRSRRGYGRGTTES